MVWKLGINFTSNRATCLEIVADLAVECRRGGFTNNI